MAYHILSASLSSLIVLPCTNIITTECCHAQFTPTTSTQLPNSLYNCSVPTHPSSLIHVVVNGLPNPVRLPILLIILPMCKHQ